METAQKTQLQWQLRPSHCRQDPVAGVRHSWAAWSLHLSGVLGGWVAQPRGCSLTSIGGHAFSHGGAGAVGSREMGMVRGGRRVRSPGKLLAWRALGRGGLPSQDQVEGKLEGNMGTEGRGQRLEESLRGRPIPGVTSSPSPLASSDTAVSPPEFGEVGPLSACGGPHRNAAPSPQVPSRHQRESHGLHFPGGVGGSEGKGPRTEPGCERGHPPNPGGSASRPRTPGTDPQRHSSDPQGGQPTAPTPLPEVAGPQETGAAWAGSASVTDGANCLLQRRDPGAQRGASEQVSQAGGGPAHPEPY